jgi:hypothetical protein
MIPLVQYSDVFVLCDLNLPTSIPGYRIRPDGLYLVLPPEDAPLFPKERATLTQHPTGYLSEPVLALPCTLSDFLALMLPLGCIDPETLADWLIEKGAGALLAGAQDENVSDWLAELLCVPPRVVAWLSPAAKPEDSAPSHNPCRLVPPRRRNDFFDAVRFVVHAFHERHGRCPTESEVWIALRSDPPGSYDIRAIADDIIMGGRIITRAMFARRWKRYTP